MTLATTNPSRTFELPSASTRLSTPWTNYAATFTTTPAYSYTPETEEQIVEIVRFAAQEGIPIRTKGGGFSFSPLLATGGILLDLSALSGITDVDSATSRVRVRAGTKIETLGGLLWEKGLSLSIQGILDQQSIVGAISTGTHGTGIEHGCISSYVRWVRLVDGSGQIQEIGEGDPRLAAAKVSLGVLGVILEVELQVEPWFYLEQQEPSFPTWAESLSELEGRVAANEHYQQMWFPHNRSAEIYHSPSREGEVADSNWVSSLNRVSEGGESEHSLTERRVGRSYQMFAVPFNEHWPKFHEVEYSVPVAAAVAAADAVRAVMTAAPDPQYPLFLRWVKGDDSMISPFADRDAVTLSIAARPEDEYWDYLRAYHDALRPFNARAHWGKLNFLTRADVERLYPRHGEFVAIRREIDPLGIFLNDATRQLFG